MPARPQRPRPAAAALSLSVGRGRTAVRLTLHRQGRDYVLLVAGGEAHVGAVALDCPRGGARGESWRALHVAPAHREGPLAAAGAATVAAATGRACVAIAGIHLDGATPAQIATLVRNVHTGYARLAARLGAAEKESR